MCLYNEDHDKEVTVIIRFTAILSVLLFCTSLPAGVTASDESPASPAAPGQVFLDPLQTGGHGPELVVVSAGHFLMGDLQDEGYSFEHPVHEVVIAGSFALGRYEVTFDEYDLFCRLTDRPLPPDQGGGRGRKPVIHVSWRDAVAYCDWLSEQTGHEYRLPSEAEWEYAARGGTRTSRFWGDRSEDACRHANVADLAAQELYPNFEIHNCLDGFPYTAPVGTFPANAFGLHDMLGNLWEWNQDTWHPDYREAPDDGSAWKGWSPNRVRRGGSWFSIPKSVRAAARNGTPKGYRGDDTGFRVVRELVSSD